MKAFVSSYNESQIQSKILKNDLLKHKTTLADKSLENDHY